MKKKWKLQGFPRREYIKCLAEAVCLTAVFAYVFYRSWIGVLVFPVLCVICFRLGKREYEGKQKRILAVQFTDMILSVNGSLQTGYSIENAFLEAKKEICQLHGENSMMARELSVIQQGLGNRVPIEQQLLKFGILSGVEEIRDFTEVFAVLKRSGGNLREMIRRTTELTRQRLETEQEIGQLLASRRFEMKIMNAVPFCMYGYVQLTSPGFFDVLYHNPAGICVMTACLVLYLAAVWMAWKIMEIRV